MNRITAALALLAILACTVWAYAAGGANYYKNVQYTAATVIPNPSGPDFYMFQIRTAGGDHYNFLCSAEVFWHILGNWNPGDIVDVYDYGNPAPDAYVGTTAGGPPSGSPTQDGVRP